ncbi:papain family cysteine protease, partial [Ancylostoma ceylanicum]
LKNNWGKPVSSSKIMSPSYVYHHIRECNCGPNCGTYIGDALELMKTKGIVSWEMMPYDENNCTPPGNSMLNAASVNKIKGYNRLNNKMNLNEYKTYLSNDVPIITGTSLGANFDYYGSRGNTSTFTCSQLKPNSGHAMLMVGYDDNRKAFKIMNSWGSDWGEKGYVWVDYECFKLMMGSSGSEAYVISKDYELSKDTHPSDDIVTTDEQNTGSDLQASFEGPYCLPDMQAIVIMKDGSKYRVEFDGCEILQHEDSYEADYVEIIPTVTAPPPRNDL